MSQSKPVTIPIKSDQNQQRQRSVETLPELNKTSFTNSTNISSSSVSLTPLDTSNRLRSWSFSRSPPTSPISTNSAGTFPLSSASPYNSNQQKSSHRRPSLSTALSTALQYQRDGNSPPSPLSITPKTPPMSTTSWSGYISSQNTFPNSMSPPSSPKRRWSQSAASSSLFFANQGRNLPNIDPLSASIRSSQSQISPISLNQNLTNSSNPPKEREKRAVSPSRERFLSGQLLD